MFIGLAKNVGLLYMKRTRNRRMRRNKTRRKRLRRGGVKIEGRHGDILVKDGTDWKTVGTGTHTTMKDYVAPPAPPKK